jgi:putative flippase GtrA
VFNEQAEISASVTRLHQYLSRTFPFTFRITIADNASTDATWELARGLAGVLPGVRAMHVEQKGRGRALRAAWSGSDAAVVAYMDVDLSTDLNALLPLVAPLLSGHSDVAIGTRLSRNSRVRRGPKRELISRSYNLILRTVLGAGFSDAQCGFKAVRADAARVLVPIVQDDAWFFDTEMLVLAERAGLRIHEVPVDWTDDPDSRVDIVRTAVDDLKGVWRLARAEASTSRQVLRFAAIGAVSTVAYIGLFALLRSTVAAQPANALALLLTAVANTAANRRYTFAVRGRAGAVRHQAAGLLVFASALALTSGSLAALRALTAAPTRGVEIGVLTVANLAATLLRFVLLRSWVFRPRRADVASCP